MAELEQEKATLAANIRASTDNLAKKAVLEDELAIVDEKLETERKRQEELANDYAQKVLEVSEFQERLQELQALNERFSAEHQSQLEAAKATNRELREVEAMMEMESAQREALEDYIADLKQEILELAAKNDVVSALELPVDVAMAEQVETPVVPETAPVIEQIESEIAPETAPVVEQIEAGIDRETAPVDKQMESNVVPELAKQVEALAIAAPKLKPVTDKRAVVSEEETKPVEKPVRMVRPEEPSDMKRFLAEVALAASRRLETRRQSQNQTDAVAVPSTSIGNISFIQLLGTVSAADAVEAQAKRRTQLEMELDLLALKKRLQAEQQEKTRLLKLSKDIQKEKRRVLEGAGDQVAVPDWIKKLNVYAVKSKTLRVKIGNAQRQDPDKLTFT